MKINHHIDNIDKESSKYFTKNIFILYDFPISIGQKLCFNRINKVMLMKNYYNIYKN